jgi:hypothetical protein
MAERQISPQGAAFGYGLFNLGLAGAAVLPAALNLRASAAGRLLARRAPVVAAVAAARAGGGPDAPRMLARVAPDARGNVGAGFHALPPGHQRVLDADGDGRFGCFGPRALSAER